VNGIPEKSQVNGEKNKPEVVGKRQPRHGNWQNQKNIILCFDDELLYKKMLCIV
jgi:hypothetical protein